MPVSGTVRCFYMSTNSSPQFRRNVDLYGADRRCQSTLVATLDKRSAPNFGLLHHGRSCGRGLLSYRRQSDDEWIVKSKFIAFRGSIAIYEVVRRKLMSLSRVRIDMSMVTGERADLTELSPLQSAQSATAN